MHKKAIIFCGEYLVIASGFILALFSYTFATDILSAVSLFISATFCLLISVASAKLLKMLFRKKRPPQRTEYFKPADRYAFPSGHATGLFSVTYFIASTDIYFGILSLLVAVLVMYGRVKSHVHDVFDILGGACVGVGITYLVMPHVTMYLVPYLLRSLL
jgi:undecaprenyl-diphosphatase